MRTGEQDLHQIAQRLGSLRAEYHWTANCQTAAMELFNCLLDSKKLCCHRRSLNPTLDLREGCLARGGCGLKIQSQRKLNFVALPLTGDTSPFKQAAILNETLPDTASLFDLASDTPLSWEEQRERVAGTDSITRSPRLHAAAATAGL